MMHKRKRTRKRSNNRKIVGYVVLQLVSGCLCETHGVLWPTKKAAVREATKIIDAYREDDRYANPKHPHYDPHCDEECRIDYDELYEAARSLQSIAINQDDDLLILAIVPSTKANSS